jgi:hypothetical protein
MRKPLSKTKNCPIPIVLRLWRRRFLGDDLISSMGTDDSVSDSLEDRQYKELQSIVDEGWDLLREVQD